MNTRTIIGDVHVLAIASLRNSHVKILKTMETQQSKNIDMCDVPGCSMVILWLHK